MPRARHVLLHCLDGASRCVAMQALLVLKDDEVQIAQQSLHIDDEMFRIMDEEPMVLLHVLIVGLEACRGRVAEETCCCAELGFWLGGRIGHMEGQLGQGVSLQGVV